MFKYQTIHCNVRNSRILLSQFYNLSTFIYVCFNVSLLYIRNVIGPRLEAYVNGRLGESLIPLRLTIPKLIEYSSAQQDFTSLKFLQSISWYLYRIERLLLNTVELISALQSKQYLAKRLQFWCHFQMVHDFMISK